MRKKINQDSPGIVTFMNSASQIELGHLNLSDRFLLLGSTAY